jgi:hypothetical protein
MDRPQDPRCRFRIGCRKPKTQLVIIIPNGVPPNIPPASRARVLERSSVPNLNPHSHVPIESSRVQLIRQRLRSEFYEVPPASEQIAASVLADLNEAKKGPSALPQ